MFSSDREDGGAVAPVMKKKGLPIPGELKEEFELAKLCVVRPYQRPFDAKRVKKITGKFDPETVNYPRIVPLSTDGIEDEEILDMVESFLAQGYTHHTENGQHTVAVLLNLGYTHAPVFELSGTLRDAALRFLTMGESGYSKTVSPLESFLVALETGNPEATAIHDLVSRYGFTLGRRDSEAANKINAVTKLKGAYKKAVLEDVLQIMTMWPYDDKRTMSDFIAALSQFLKLKSGDRKPVDVERFKNRLMEPRVKNKPAPTPTSIWVDANASSVSQNGTIGQYVSLFKEIYNKNLKEGSRIP